MRARRRRGGCDGCWIRTASAIRALQQPMKLNMHGWPRSLLAFGLAAAAALLPRSCSLPHAPLPLYRLMPNSSEWLRTLPKSQAESALTAYAGDIRARLVVSEEDLEQQQGVVTAQILWRRRDPRPENKSVIVTDERGAIIPSSAHLVETACGVISFAPRNVRLSTAPLCPLLFGGPALDHRKIKHFRWSSAGPPKH
eukprot:SAG31_NODE_5220_length_2668_cov_1.470611_1_plen_197_part_00